MLKLSKVIYVNNCLKFAQVINAHNIKCGKRVLTICGGESHGTTKQGKPINVHESMIHPIVDSLIL